MGHKEEAQRGHRWINEISNEIFSLIEALQQCLMEKEKQQNNLKMKGNREKRKHRRNIFRTNAEDLKEMTATNHRPMPQSRTAH